MGTPVPGPMSFLTNINLEKQFNENFNSSTQAKIPMNGEEQNTSQEIAQAANSAAQTAQNAQTLDSTAAAANVGQSAAAAAQPQAESSSAVQTGADSLKEAAKDLSQSVDAAVSQNSANIAESTAKSADIASTTGAAQAAQTAADEAAKNTVQEAAETARQAAEQLSNIQTGGAGADAAAQGTAQAAQAVQAAEPAASQNIAETISTTAQPMADASLNAPDAAAAVDPSTLSGAERAAHMVSDFLNACYDFSVETIKFFKILLSQPHAFEIFAGIVVIILLLWLARRLYLRFAPVRLFKSGIGKVEVTRAAMNSLAESVCYGIGAMNKPDVKIYSRRGRLCVDVSLVLEAGQSLAEISYKLQNSLTIAFREHLGVEKLGGVNVKILEFRGLIHKPMYRRIESGAGNAASMRQEPAVNIDEYQVEDKK